MQEFRDKTGQAWKIDLPIGEVTRIRKADARFNLWEPTKEDLAQKLFDDLPLFWELLWQVVEPQAVVRNITAEQFGESVAAECLIDAQKKFFDEWRDFFHRLQRPDLATVLEKLAKYQAKAMELVKAKLGNGAMTGLDERVEAKMQATLNERFGKLRESLDSILDPSPGVNSGGSEPASSATNEP